MVENAGEENGGFEPMTAELSDRSPPSESSEGAIAYTDAIKHYDPGAVGNGTTTGMHAARTASEGGPNEGPSLVFRDVGVTIGKKVILQKICGLARVGQTLAVMGPSGAGKSTLLNTLVGRVPPSSGTITLNGQAVTRHLRRKFSYVPQADVFYPNLSLKETLTFTAMLRLPDRMPKALKIKRIQEVVEALELNKCLETKIGGVFVPGLSGGERKRAAIACELLTNPSILILDEPTSGLDAAIAYSLMSILNKYVREHHKTVVTTIHQPSSQIFYLFHNVLLLTDGEVAYFGPRDGIVNFFSRLGFQCEQHYNPADFILEQVKTGPEAVKKIIEGSYAMRTEDAWPVELREPQLGKALTHGEPVTPHWKRGGKGWRQGKTSASDVEAAGQETQDGGAGTIPGQDVDVGWYINEDAKWQTGFLTQFTTLTQRQFLQQRDRFLSKLNIGLILFVAFIAGLQWFGTPRDEANARNRVGVLFYVVVQYGIVPLTEAVLRIYDASGVFLRERSSGIWRLSAFYLAVMTSEIPALVAMITVYSAIIYWMAGLTPEPGNFFAFIAVLLLSAVAAQSIGFFIGVVVLNKQIVVSIAMTMMVSSILCGGYYNTNAVYWFFWIRYLSFLSYGLSALSQIEFDYGPDLKCNPPTTTSFPQYCGDSNSTAVATLPGSAFLAEQNLAIIPLYANILVLVGIVIVFRTAAYVALRFTRLNA